MQHTYIQQFMKRKLHWPYCKGKTQIITYISTCLSISKQFISPLRQCLKSLYGFIFCVTLSLFFFFFGYYQSHQTTKISGFVFILMMKVDASFTKKVQFIFTICAPCVLTLLEVFISTAQG